MERERGYYGTGTASAAAGFATNRTARHRPERGQVKCDERRLRSLLGWAPFPRREGGLSRCASGNNQQQNVIAALHKKARQTVSIKWSGMSGNVHIKTTFLIDDTKDRDEMTKAKSDSKFTIMGSSHRQFSNLLLSLSHVLQALGGVWMDG